MTEYYSQAVAIGMASQLFNVLAIREIRQGLRLGKNPLARGDFLDFFNLLQGLGFPVDRVHKLNNKYFISFVNDKVTIDHGHSV
jgi:hypothetical protein